MKKIYIVILILLLSLPGLSQNNTRYLTLQDAIAIAREKAPDALAAKHQFRSKYWQYRTFQATYRPKLNLNATLPDLNRSIQSIQQDDGSFIFRSSESASSSVNMKLSQKIGFTGGEIFMRSGVERLDIFQDDSTVTSYLTTPINIGLTQPLFDFVPYKWDKKIEPLKYKEAKQSYIESMEQVALKTTNLFFDVLMAQMQHQINKINRANNDTLYKIARGRYNIGTIAENELLQLELSLLKSQSAVEESELTLEDRLFRLKSFLKLPEDEPLELVPPEDLPVFDARPDKAIRQALDNQSQALAFERRLMQANREVNKARMQNRFSMDVYAVYGLTQSAVDFTNAYRDPSEQQRLSVGISVPIVDWGLAKGQIRMAESNRELVRSEVDQDRIDFRQEVYLQVMQFNMQDNQLRIAAKSDTVARKRYNVTKQRYMIGKISITELNIAQEEKDNAQLGYIRALSDYWQNYYRLRKETLYNFREDQKIQVNPEELLEN